MSKAPKGQKRRSQPSNGHTAEAEATSTTLVESTARKKANGGTKKQNKVAIKYRDGESTWSGRGSQPRWLKAALAGGKSIEDFAV